MAAEIKKSILGRRLGLTSGGRLVCPQGFISGDPGSQRYHGNPGMVEIWDDFLGDVIADEWNSRKGSDGATVDWAVNAQKNGVIRGVTGAGAGVTMAANGIQIDSALNWYPSQGGLSMQARVLSPTSVASLALFIGFTDQVAALEMPATISSGTLTTNFTDGVGFLFDTAATAATMKLVGVANDVDATMQDTGAAYLSTTVWRTFRVELDYDSVGASLVGANFYIDGAQVGTTMLTPCTATVALTPVIAGFRRTATLANIDIDYLHVAAVRG